LIEYQKDMRAGTTDGHLVVAYLRHARECGEMYYQHYMPDGISKVTAQVA